MITVEKIGGWRIEQVLGRGGMAVVYKGIWEGDSRYPTGRVAALKWLNSTTPAIVERFAREIRCIQQLQAALPPASKTSGHIVRLYEQGSWGGRPYYAMEFIQGMDLRGVARRLQRLSPFERHQKVRENASALCELLYEIHKVGIIHRDIKPANVLVESEGIAPRVVLTDFGIAALEEEAGLTQAGVVLGTAAYAAPEQLEGGLVDERVDQFGLGGTLFFLLTEQPPHTGELRARAPKAPSTLDPTIPPDLDALITRLLEPRPELRFRSLKEAKEILTGTLAADIPLAGRQQVIDAIAGVLDRVAAGEQVRLFLDGPIGAGKRWALTLARSAAQRRGIVLGNALILLEKFESGCCQIALPPLSLAEVRRTLFAAAPRTPDLAQVAARLHRQTGGNPGMLVQLIRHYSQEGSLSLPDGPLEMDPTRWLTDLDLDQQTVAGVLALAELPLSLESISAIAQVPAETVLPELVRRAIALEEGGSWKLAAEILRAPLQALVFDPEGMEARIKEHHPQAEVLPEDPLLMEVAQLQAQARLSEAIALLSARIEEPGQLLSRRQVQLGLLEWQHGDLSASWTHFAAALGAVQPTVRAQAHIGIGLAALHIGHIQAALDHLQHGRVEAELAGDRTLEVLAWLNLASAHLWAGALASASLDAQRALGLARSIGERKLECRALLMIGQVRLALEQAVEAGRVLADASALAKALDLEEERLLAHVLRAWSSLKEHPMDRTAAAAALDRLATQRALSVDPEGIFLQLRALRAWALAATGDRIRAERLRADINTSGVRVVVRLKLELLLLEAARAAGAALEVQERAARLLQESDAWGFVYASWKVRRILTAVTGEASPEIFTVSTGLSEEEKRILLESDRPR